MSGAPVYRVVVESSGRNGAWLVDRAADFADRRLFAAALATDRDGTVPSTLLDEMRDLGLFGLFSPSGVGGHDLEPSDRYRIIEVLAGGCLTTTFVWLQHAGPAAATAGASGPAHAFAEPLASGRCTGGVAFAHLLRSGPPTLTVSANGDEWVLNGFAPYVTGWGWIDVVLVAARSGGEIVWLLLDAVEAASLRASRLQLAAVDSSQTAAVTFDDHIVSSDRLVRIDRYADWLVGYRAGLRANGSLALGVAGRCARLLGDGDLAHQVDSARSALDAADTDGLPAARSEASLLAMRAATMLVTSKAGRSVMGDDHAQRLAREAMFLLVQGQTSEIRQHQLAMLRSAP